MQKTTAHFEADTSLDAAAQDVELREKFVNPLTTLDGQPRASVALGQLKTLWFNTGTLCNIACSNCYIESTPTNDRLSYLTFDEVTSYLDEIQTQDFATEEIGITGGEPFMNPDIVPIMQACLSRGFSLAGSDQCHATYDAAAHTRCSVGLTQTLRGAINPAGIGRSF